MSNERKLFDMTQKNHQIMAVAMLNMVEEDGLTPHQVFEVMNHSHGQLWSALCEAHADVKAGRVGGKQA